MSDDFPPPPSRPLPPPPSRPLPPLPGRPLPHLPAPTPTGAPEATTAAVRVPRAGELTAAWRAMVTVTWIGVFIAYMAVWKASDELGIGTWWLGARSSPQPVPVRLVPFVVAAVFGLLAASNLRRVPLISAVGSLVLAVIAVPDLTRSLGLAAIELSIAAAALLVSAAALTGTFRPGDGAG